MQSRFDRLTRYLRSSFWFWPVVFIVVGWWAAGAVAELSTQLPHDPTQLTQMRQAASLYAAPVLTTIAASAITVVTFVFSTLMVVMQLASSQLSPRILRKTIREGRAQLVMAVLVGTFAYAFRALLIIFTSRDALVPMYLVIAGIVLMIASVLSFLYFVGFVADRVRAPAVIRAIETETEMWLKRTYSFDEPAYDGTPLPETDSRTRTPIRARRSGSITGIDTQGLTAWAVRNEAEVRLSVGLGSQVTEGVRIGEVLAAGELSAHDAILRRLTIDRERTIPGDPPWGFRMLVDIANRALSPAVNDPTTAVQVLDALEELLAVLAERSEQPGVFYDKTGVVRLKMPVMSWRSYLELATHEIYLYGSHSPQVTQRLSAMVEELASVVTTPDRLRALEELRAKIVVVEPLVPQSSPS